MESVSATVVYNDNYNKKYSGREETLSAVSEDNLFEQFYKKNNQLKYCNGCYYEFKDKSIEVKYKKWTLPTLKKTKATMMDLML